MMLRSWKSRNNDQQAYHVSASICKKSIPHQLPTTSSENSLRDKISHLHLLTCIPLAIELLSSLLHDGFFHRNPTYAYATVKHGSNEHAFNENWSVKK